MFISSFSTVQITNLNRKARQEREEKLLKTWRS
jgi:hypothetical protein